MKVHISQFFVIFLTIISCQKLVATNPIHVQSDNIISVDESIRYNTAYNHIEKSYINLNRYRNKKNTSFKEKLQNGIRKVLLKCSLLTASKELYSTLETSYFKNLFNKKIFKSSSRSNLKERVYLILSIFSLAILTALIILFIIGAFIPNALILGMSLVAFGSSFTALFSTEKITIILGLIGFSLSLFPLMIALIFYLIFLFL